MLGRSTRLSWATLAVLALLLTFAALAMPGAAQAAPATGSIEGTITNSVTGLPVSAVSVYAQSVDPAPYFSIGTSVDGRGHFRITGVPEGEYTVYYASWWWMGGSTPYFTQYFDGASTWETATRIQVIGGAVAFADASLEPVPALTEDAFEPDDEFKSAPLVAADGASARHSLYPSGDVDTVKLPVKAGYLYSVNAAPLNIPMMYVYTRVRVFDQARKQIPGDEWGQFTFVAPADGYAYVQVAGEWGSTGFYDFAITETEPATIGGKVTTEDTHAALRDVGVELYTWYEDSWGGWVDWKASVQTDANGDYTFDAVDSGSTYRLRFSTQNQPGYVSEWYDNVPMGVGEYGSTPVLVAAGEKTAVDCELSPAGSMGGTVADQATDEPLADIEVWVSGIGDATSGYSDATTTDDHGNYELGSLAPGEYKVYFVDSTSGYRSEWFADQPTSDSADPVGVSSNSRTPCDAKLSLKTTSRLVRGVVTDRADGAPIDDIEVTVSRVDAFDAGSQSGYSTRTGRDGSFRIGGIGSESGPEARWSIAFGDPHSGYQTQYFRDQPVVELAEFVDLPVGEFYTADAQLDIKPDTAKISGKLTEDLTGEPIAGGWVSWQTFAGLGTSGYGSMSGYDSYGFTDENGDYSLRGIPSGEPVVVFATNGHSDFSEFWENKPNGWLADKITLAAGDTRNLDFALTGTGKVFGQVTEDGTGKPLPGVTVELYSDIMMSSYADGWSLGLSSYSTTTDKNGEYTFDPLDPNATYKIRYVDTGTAAHQSEFYNDKDSIETGDEIRVPDGGTFTASAGLARNAALGSIVGKVTNYAGGAALSVVQVDLYAAAENPDGSFSPDYLWDREHTLPDGTYGFSGLPADQTYLIKFTDTLGRVNEQWFDGLAGTSTSATPLRLVGGGDALVANAALFVSEGAPPVTTASVSSLREANGWRSTPSTVTLSPFDVGSGIAETLYKVGNAAPRLYSVPFAVPAGDVVVTYWSIDRSGNVEGEHTLSVKSEAAPPTTTPSYIKKSGKWASSPTTVTLSAVDTQSGAAGTVCSIDGAALGAYNGAFQLSLPAGAARSIPLGFRSTDNVGNVEMLKSSDVWIDNKPPTVPSGLGYSVTSPTSITLAWTASTDGDSGLASYVVYKDAQYLGTVTSNSCAVANPLPTGAVYTVVAVDNVGNASAPSVSTSVGGQKFSLTYLSGSGGRVVGASPQTVDYNANGTEVRAVADTGYHFVKWSDENRSATRIDANVLADHTYTAIFAVDTHQLTYSAGVGGDVLGVKSQTVDYGANGTAVTAVPATGYHFVKWSDGNLNATRTDANVVADAAYSAVFAVPVVTSTEATATFDGDITTAGTLTVEPRATVQDLPAPPAGTFQVANSAFEVKFSGGFVGSWTLTFPYDSDLPPDMVDALTVQHYVASSNTWETLRPLITDKEHHTVTVVTSSLSPFVVSAPLALIPVAEFSPATASSTSPIIGTSVSIESHLTNKPTGIALLGRPDVILQSSRDGIAWTDESVAVSPLAGGVYRATFVAANTSTVAYRLYLASGAYLTGGSSAPVTIAARTASLPSTTVSRASVSPSRPKHGKTASFNAYVDQGGAAATSGTSTLRLYRWETKTVRKKVGRRWKKVKVKYWRLRYTGPMAGDSSGLLTARTKVKYSGKWKMSVSYNGSSSYAPSTRAAEKTFSVK